MDKLAGWILDRMSAYKGGGVPYGEAARFTLGEMRAFYSGNHWTHGKRSPKPRLPEEQAVTEAERVLAAVRTEYEA